MNTPDCGDAPVSRPARILLVEDHDATSKGLSKFLIAMGYEVEVVLDGASALVALRAGPPPDFVLTDLCLPDSDGREIAWVARQLNPAPRIALITGWDLESALQDQTTWGIDWVFTKPLNVNELILRMRETMPSSRASDAQTLSPSSERDEGTP